MVRRALDNTFPASDWEGVLWDSDFSSLSGVVVAGQSPLEFDEAGQKLRVYICSLEFIFWRIGICSSTLVFVLWQFAADVVGGAAPFNHKRFPWFSQNSLNGGTIAQFPQIAHSPDIDSSGPRKGPSVPSSWEAAGKLPPLLLGSC